MESHPDRRLKLRPLGVYAYFDKLQFWVRNPLDRNIIAQLRKQCGRGGIHAENRPARFSAQYRQRIELRQPTDQALRWLARRDDALINRAEITIDLVFNSPAERYDAWEFLHRHIVRRWHGKKQQIRIFKTEPEDERTNAGTRYDAGGWAPNRIVLYPEEHSRVTGELYCLHVEWRLNRLKAVRSAGIESGRDLLEFDHREFWKKRLLLLDVDCRRIGSLIRNQVTGKRSRASTIRSIGRSIDGRVGEVLVRAHSTVQELIDQMNSSVRIHRALVPISNEKLLPE